jgi:lipopolysaccharide export system protein LptA
VSMYRRIMRMNRIAHTSLFSILLLLASATGYLPPLAAEENSFSFSGNSTSISLAEGRQRTILSGDARISSETLTIEADHIELYGEDFRYARCNGNLKVRENDQKISLTSDSLFLDRQQNKLRIRSYSEMVDLRNEIVVKSGYMEHYDEENYSVFQIGVRILKATEDGRMVCRSDYARYDREVDTLELSGSPVVFWKGDRYSAVRITIDLETDEIEMEGNVEGEFTSRTEEEPADGAADNSQD